MDPRDVFFGNRDGGRIAPSFNPGLREVRLPSSVRDRTWKPPLSPGEEAMASALRLTRSGYGG